MDKAQIPRVASAALNFNLLKSILTNLLESCLFSYAINKTLLLAKTALWLYHVDSLGKE